MTNGFTVAVLREFFRAVSFERGERPAYSTLRELFIAEGKLINLSGDVADIASVDGFIAPRQRAVDSGALAWFEEVELDGVDQVFGNVAHRFSNYAKVGERDGVEFSGRGMISTQFVRTRDGWRISSMAWDDERPGLSLP
jgi:hypothetical protein